MLRKETHTDKLAQSKRKKQSKAEKNLMEQKEYEEYWENELANMPLLMIPLTGSTEFHKEYVPGLNHRWMDLLHMHYLLLRMRFNRPIYYWHIRSLKNPIQRKRYDLMFAAHVITEHDGEATDKVERKHYKRVQSRYGAELDYFKPVFEAHRAGERAYWDTYAQAYADMWIRESFPGLKVLFHGMSLPEFIEYREYEDDYLKRELKRLLAQNAARSRWTKIRSK